MKKYLAVIVFCIVSFSALAQDFPYGSHTDAELDMKRYEKDTAAHAVVLREFGHSFVDNDDLSLSINMECHVKIKIFDSKAYDQANIVFHLSSAQHLKNIRGVTFFKDNKGIEQRTDLSPGSVFTEADGDGSVVKFTLPNLHENCIIEYSYTKTNTYQRNFEGWVFQWDIPNIYSEYVTEIPAFFSYNILLRGGLKLTKKETTIEKSCVVIYDADVTAGCIKTVYVMEDIPAFVKEDHTIADKNFISSLHFELYAFKNGNGDNKLYADEWPKVEQTLLNGGRFGQQISRKGVLRSVLPKSTFEINDTLTRARTVYTNVQKLFKFTGENSKYSLNIKTAIEKHKGDSGDINLSLIAALGAAGINAEPVILSTTEHGVVSKFFPTLTEFNYVIARVIINNTQYLLDATDPLLPFGLLPLNCIYDQGRVIPSGKPSYWINLSPAEKGRSIVQLDMDMLENGKFKGTVTKYFFGYDAYHKRSAIKKYNNVDEYVENLDERSPQIKILRSEITNIDSLDQPLTETYDVEIDNSEKFNKDNKIAFIPAFWSQITQNPFLQNKRSYPVYLGYSSDDKLILNMHYPDKYQIINKPTDVGLLLPNKGGMFATQFHLGNGIFNYSETVQLNKAEYSSEEYPYLKEFYNKIIQTQKANIEFAIK